MHGKAMGVNWRRRIVVDFPNELIQLLPELASGKALVTCTESGGHGGPTIDNLQNIAMMLEIHDFVVLGYQVPAQAGGVGGGIGQVE